MTATHDVIVVGAGIAGASAAAEIAAHRRVVVLEAEERPGVHSTGRSAALWILNYGPADVRALSAASRPFLEGPPQGFAAHALVAPRAVLFVAPEGQEAALAAMMAEGQGLEELSPAAARALVPVLRADYARAAAIERDGLDLDVAAIHQGYLRLLRTRGGEVRLDARAGRVARTGGLWQVDLGGGEVLAAPVLVNAAGAWGDELAEAAGVAPIGLRPLRRTACIVDGPAIDGFPGWPLMGDAAHSWYCRPEARTKLLVSPADETPSAPCDAQPEEIDVALGIDRMQVALDIPVRRVEHRWAGLRTFTPDGSLAIGWDAKAEGFFWLAGQGGYGIQTAPAAARLAASLVLGRDPDREPGLSGIARRTDPARFHSQSSGRRAAGWGSAH
ncbi:MAG: FAD-binding oxidoreductase [Alphaproteobacteria bacterium]|nr:FAD-binding oxidoreductase [Alphaproteobacteria bacterium]